MQQGEKLSHLHCFLHVAKFKWSSAPVLMCRRIVCVNKEVWWQISPDSSISILASCEDHNDRTTDKELEEGGLDSIKEFQGILGATATRGSTTLCHESDGVVWSAEIRNHHREETIER
jgi:hypothetical protein